MVKLNTCLEALTKGQLEIISNFTAIPINTSENKKNIIEKLSKELTSKERLEGIARAFTPDDIEVLRMLWCKKSTRYHGVTPTNFANFLIQNKRAGRCMMSKRANKLTSEGLIFVNINIKNKQKVVFPSDYFSFFTPLLENGHGINP